MYIFLNVCSRVCMHACVCVCFSVSVSVSLSPPTWKIKIKLGGVLTGLHDVINHSTFIASFSKKYLARYESSRSFAPLYSVAPAVSVDAAVVTIEEKLRVQLGGC